ncbi:MAG: DUF2344 domain-containing protein [Clostridia bacterium]|nr:DUF2344 domain-containing protein [Clostridia bacterium]
MAWDFVMDDIHPQSKTLTVRLGFYKVGDMQFISHLDLQRFMKRAFVRSGLPIWFSEGFNPHPKMVFSTPLSIGIQSECEFADTKMTAPVTPAQVVDALNPCMPDTLQLFYAAPPVHKMTDIGYASYDIRITHPQSSPEMASAMDALFSSPLILTKKSKAGDRDTDITPLIRSASTVYDPADNTMTLHCVLCADNANFLNPEYLMRGAARDLGLTFDDPASAWYECIRRDLFLCDGTTPFL